MKLQQLAKLRIFAALDDAGLEEIAAFSRVSILDVGAWLFREGDAASSFIGVLSGRVKVVKMGPGGREAILEVFGPGDTLAEVPAIDGGSYPASASTMERSEIIRIEAEGFREMLARNNRIALALIREMASLLRVTTRRIQALQTERVEPRLAALVLQLGKRLGEPSEKGLLIDGKWTRQDLADLVGATQETVIRILSRWQKSGWIGRGARLELYDLQALAKRRDALED